MGNIVSIREAVQRSKADGMPISEYTLRHWVKTGAVPVRKIGQKALLFYPNLVKYLQCDESTEIEPTNTVATSGIRRVEI